jgi:hypothetical protein
VSAARMVAPPDVMRQPRLGRAEPAGRGIGRFAGPGRLVHVSSVYGEVQAEGCQQGLPSRRPGGQNQRNAHGSDYIIPRWGGQLATPGKDAIMKMQVILVFNQSRRWLCAHKRHCREQRT